MSKNATRRSASTSPESGPVCLHLLAETSPRRRPQHESIIIAHARFSTLPCSPFLHRAPCPAQPCGSALPQKSHSRFHRTSSTQRSTAVHHSPSRPTRSKPHHRKQVHTHLPCSSSPRALLAITTAARNDPWRGHHPLVATIAPTPKNRRRDANASRARLHDDPRRYDSRCRLYNTCNSRQRDSSCALSRAHVQRHRVFVARALDHSCRGPNARGSVASHCSDCSLIRSHQRDKIRA